MRPPVQSRAVAARLADVRSLPTELLWNLTLRELRGKFKRSVLGWLWSVINPLAMILVFIVVFSIVFRAEPPVGDPSGLHSYGFWLVSGLLPWTYVANSLTEATNSIISNEGLVKKVYFPRAVLPGASTLASLATFGVELLVFGVLLLFVAGNMIIPWIPVVVALMMLQTVFLFGLGLFLSAANAFFRDVQHFLAIALNIWFWSTPIIYPAELAEENAPTWIYRLLELNPMFLFVDAYRDVMYNLRWPTVTQWLVLCGIAAVSLILGAAAFRRLEPRLAEEL